MSTTDTTSGTDTTPVTDTPLVADYATERRFTAPLGMNDGSIASTACVIVAGTERVFGVLAGHSPTRRDENDQPSPPAPAWVGVNVTLHAPDVRGFDVTAGVRNLIGRRDLVPAPGDYDRSIPDRVVIARVPREGREVYDVYSL